MKYCWTFRPSRKLVVIGRFDDRAVGLGHQAAHAGQLADLRRATAGARVGHHEDGVERLLALLLAAGSRSTSSVPSFSIIALATWSLARDQMSTTLL